MAKQKMPDAYKMVARSRKDIVADILDLTEQRYSFHDTYHLCFNVKAYGVDFSFSNMLEKWKYYNGDQPYMHNPEWLEQVKEKYEEVKQYLWEWGVETARMQFAGPHSNSAYQMLWDGTPVSVQYEFVGRSGGWLAITEFEGYDFDRPLDEDLETVLMDMEYQTLRKLYRLVLMLKHDLRDPEGEIELNAAFDLFANVCGDINIPDATQGRLFMANEELEKEIIGS